MPGSCGEWKRGTMSTTVRVAEAAKAAATAGAEDEAAKPDITVIGSGAPPAATASARAVFRIIRVYLAQLTLFFWVDTFAALVRRRHLATSAGRRAGIVLVKLGPGYAKLARLMAS